MQVEEKYYPVVEELLKRETGATRVKVNPLKNLKCMHVYTRRAANLQMPMLAVQCT